MLKWRYSPYDNDYSVDMLVDYTLSLQKSFDLKRLLFKTDEQLYLNQRVAALKFKKKDLSIQNYPFKKKLYKLGLF